MKFSQIVLIAFIMFSCQPSEPVLVADTIFFNGRIYTMNEANPNAEAVVVIADTFSYIGTKSGAEAFRGGKTQLVDLNGMTMIPGLIDGHAHIMGVGYNLLNVNLREAKSYDDMVKIVAEHAKNLPEGTWIIGRGWHQDKWKEKPEMMKGFPVHDLLSEEVPNHAVWLKHSSGHAALGNMKAMEIAGIDKHTPQPKGGEIFMDINGYPTGIFNETAQKLVTNSIPSRTKKSDSLALKLALEQCFKYGITGIHQAGSGWDHINLYKEFAARGDLKLRLYVMLDGRDETLLEEYFKKGIEENLYHNQLTIRSVKLYADGALGSRGAWLLEEYTDAPGVHGHNVMPMDSIEDIVRRAHEVGFQVCVHAIGDRANREVLDVYERTLKSDSEDVPEEPRFRIEHAQHFHPTDISRFAEMGIIASMQAIHMSSDRPWAINRLGQQRIEWGAYKWQTILQSGARIVNGTDAPVESITPFASIYASVSRKTLSGNPEGGYESAEKMTRIQALKSYTLDAAYAAFQEDKKGSIEVGKWADITVLDKDIMTIPEDKILYIEVVMTIIGGEVVYQK